MLYAQMLYVKMLYVFLNVGVPRGNYVEFHCVNHHTLAFMQFLSTLVLLPPFPRSVHCCSAWIPPCATICGVIFYDTIICFGIRLRKDPTRRASTFSTRGHFRHAWIPHYYYYFLRRLGFRYYYILYIRM